jgi:hypothetical protein
MGKFPLASRAPTVSLPANYRIMKYIPSVSPSRELLQHPEAVFFFIPRFIFPQGHCA